MAQIGETRANKKMKLPCISIYCIYDCYDTRTLPIYTYGGLSASRILDTRYTALEPAGHRPATDLCLFTAFLIYLCNTFGRRFLLASGVNHAFLSTRAEQWRK